MYMTHVHWANEDNLINRVEFEENKLRALFNVLDSDQRHKITKADFVKILKEKVIPNNFIERMKKKSLKGQGRYVTALRNEFSEIDMGLPMIKAIPLTSFQKICADYDLPLMEMDLAFL